VKHRRNRNQRRHDRGRSRARAARRQRHISIFGHSKRSALHRRYGRAQDAGKLRLWKLNEVTGLWVCQRTVTPETADEWRRIFQIDEPTAVFTVSRNKPIPPALRKAIRRGSR
jgi:hypothetical protein